MKTEDFPIRPFLESLVVTRGQGISIPLSELLPFTERIPVYHQTQPRYRSRVHKPKDQITSIVISKTD